MSATLLHMANIEQSAVNVIEGEVIELITVAPAGRPRLGETWHAEAASDAAPTGYVTGSQGCGNSPNSMSRSVGQSAGGQFNWLLVIICWRGRCITAWRWTRALTLAALAWPALNYRRHIPLCRCISSSAGHYVW